MAERVVAHVSKKLNIPERKAKAIFKDLAAQRANYPEEKPLLWIHCASLGEFEQVRPCIEHLQLHHKEEIGIAVTFFSPSGYNWYQKHKFHVDICTYQPLNTPANAKKFLDILNPQLVMLVKYEYRYDYCKEILKRNIPLCVVSSVFRKNHVYFNWAAAIYLPIFKQFDKIFVQDTNSLRLLGEHGVNAVWAGDTRYDRVSAIAATHTQSSLPHILRFAQQDKRPIMVWGSLWQEGWKRLHAVVAVHRHQLRHIIAPHEIHESFLQHIESTLQSQKVSYMRYTAWEKQKGSNVEVLIMDNIGMLSRVYAYAHYAYVGGGYKGKLHNVLEAAVYGMPLFIGHHKKNPLKFIESTQLATEGVLHHVAEANHLSQHIANYLQHENVRQEIVEKAKRFVENNKGCTAIILRYVKEKLLNS